MAARNKQRRGLKTGRVRARSANRVDGPLDKTVEGVTALALAARNKWRRSLKTGRVHARTRHTW